MREGSQAFDCADTLCLKPETLPFVWFVIFSCTLHDDLESVQLFNFPHARFGHGFAVISAI
jgi:hypothetical protein